MTFLEFITKTAPEYCGVNPSYGEIAALVFESEQTGNIAFAQESFEDMVDRAMMVIPYRAEAKPGTFEHVKNFVVYVGLVHRQNSHGEMDERIGLLSKKIREDNPKWLDTVTILGGWQ